MAGLSFSHNGRIALLALSVFFGGTLSSFSAEPVQIRALPGVEEVLYSWMDNKCGPDFTADAPLRAFRDKKGDVIAFATHVNNWFLSGSSLLSVKSNCRPALPMIDYQHVWQGPAWTEATYSLDGQSVVALLSEDLTQKVESEGCQQKGNGNNCWRNQIVSAYSSNQGRTFSPLPIVVAGPPNRYDLKKGGRQGFFTTSNIVSLEGSYFFAAFEQGIDGTEPGNCLFHSRTPFIASSWKPWNSAPSAGNGACTPIGKGVIRREIRSLSYLPVSKVWIAIFMNSAPEAPPHSAVYYAMSRDLISWSKATILLDFSVGEIKTFVPLYPSLIDPKSKDRNFGTLDHAQADLFFVKLFKGAAGQHALNRQIVYRQISIR
jgi:hypothetical protein